MPNTSKRGRMTPARLKKLIEAYETEVYNPIFQAGKAGNSYPSLIHVATQSHLLLEDLKRWYAHLTKES